MKAYLAEYRYTVSIKTMNTMNNMILGMTKQEIRLRKEVHEDCFYYMPMKIEQFRELCKLVNINYFLRFFFPTLIIHSLKDLYLPECFSHCLFWVCFSWEHSFSTMESMETSN